MKSLLLPVSVLLLVSFGVNIYLLSRESRPTTSEQSSAEELQKKYPYLSQKVLSSYNRDILINFYDLRENLNREVEPYKDSFSVYFEYLPTGSVIGINQDAQFYAASLIKVPVVMAYYYGRNREFRKDDPEVTIQQKDIDSKFGTLWKRGVGSKIRMSEAVRLALVESDNTAGNIILNRISEQDFYKVYEGLDIALQVENEETIVNAEQYASVLKALYYSSLLPLNDSNHILSTLTQTKFRDKLPAGVAGEIPIAHKVGILGETLYQDCGIVYLPRRPYLLCLISNSDNVTATKRMKKVSSLVYNFVLKANSQRKEN